MSTNFQLFGPTTADVYKMGHGPLYPRHTNFAYGNGTPRADRLFIGSKSQSQFWDHKVVWFGIQAVMREVAGIWDTSFFKRDKATVIRRYKRRMDTCIGPGMVDIEAMAALHDLGYLPITVLSIPEGARLNMNVPGYVIYNTKPEFYWVVNYLETIMSSLIWAMITNTTIAYEYRRVLEHFAHLTGSPIEGVDFQGHDFALRGINNPTAAAFSNSGHLVFFKGTDTLPAIDFVEDMYFADAEKEFLAASVVATEHAVATSNILYRLALKIKALGKTESEIPKEELDALKLEAEREFIIEAITEKVPTGIISLVSDSFDFWGVLTRVFPSIKEEILSRQPDANGLAKVVIRPDCYSSDTSILTPNGWKLFTELTEDDFVAQVHDDGTHTFVKPTKIINQPYIGPMHHFKDHHGKVDVLVTPNHRMVLNQLNRGTGETKERIVEAANLVNGNCLQSMSRSAASNKTGKVLTPMERLNIAFQADGAYSTGVSSSVRFHFTKSRKIIRMVELLQSAEIDFKLYPITAGGYEFNVKVDRELMFKDFSWVDTTDLHSDWCKEFIDELSYWDATVRSDQRIKFDTTNPQVVPVVELIAISAGYTALISTRDDNRQDYFRDVTSIHIMKDNQIGGQSWINEVILYEGTVHCVTVPTGKVLVKRNKCTLVSGNSGDPVEVICGREIFTEEEIDLFITGGTNVGGKFVQKKDGVYIIKSVGRQSYITELYERTPEERGAVECLWETFGGTVNEKGFKVLHERIGLIYGDSITVARTEEIMRRLMKKGFASSNWVLGIGSYTYQHNTRDTFGFAVKATAIQVDDLFVELFKAPKTEGETNKKSAKGFLKVVRDEAGNYILEQNQTFGIDEIDTSSGELKVVFKDGKFPNPVTFSEVRARAALA